MDPATETLFYALATEPALCAQGTIGFLGARFHPRLREMGAVALEQDQKAQVDRLTEAGLTVGEQLQGPYSLVMLLPERQKEATLAAMARGLALLEPEGTLLVAMPNDLGAARFEKLLGKLAGQIWTTSKNKCRAFWTRRTPMLEETLRQEWAALDAERQVIGGRFQSRPGLFSWDRIDPGSQMLAEHLPEYLAGAVADLGAGWGYLSDFVLRQRPRAKSLAVFEADRRALACCQRNLAAISLATTVSYHWQDVTASLGASAYDFIVMNPPFHEGRQADSSLGQEFIQAAARALRPRGQLWMVANRHLPYERTLGEVLANSFIVAQREGFKILTGTRA